jgi:hypothetical protein
MLPAVYRDLPNPSESMAGTNQAVGEQMGMGERIDHQRTTALPSDRFPEVAAGIDEFASGMPGVADLKTI